MRRDLLSMLYDGDDGFAGGGANPGASARGRYAATEFLVTSYPVCKLIQCAESWKSTKVNLL
jgi:hypothetical protein